MLIPLDSLARKNDGLTVKIKFICYLGAEILTKTYFSGSHFSESKMAAM